jgi:hypothetical protein
MTRAADDFAAIRARMLELDAPTVVDNPSELLTITPTDSPLHAYFYGFQTAEITGRAPVRYEPHKWIVPVFCSDQD